MPFDLRRFAARVLQVRIMSTLHILTVPRFRGYGRCATAGLNIPRDAASCTRSICGGGRPHRSLCHQGRAASRWRDAVQAACAAKLSIRPDATLPIHERIAFTETKVQVANETTLGASRRLVARGLRPLALNFANGIQPGGGFLFGARAQEEVLCRSSALDQTLVGDPMYEEHRKRPLPDSTDWAIYSPDVPCLSPR